MFNLRKVCVGSYMLKLPSLFLCHTVLLLSVLFRHQLVPSYKAYSFLSA